jgi:hypothetical protein
MIRCGQSDASRCIARAPRRDAQARLTMRGQSIGAGALSVSRVRAITAAREKFSAAIKVM